MAVNQSNNLLRLIYQIFIILKNYFSNKKQAYR